MTALALLLLAATPINEFPFDKGVRVKDEGTGAATQAQQARGVNCVGGGVDCHVDGGWLFLSISTDGGGGGGSGAPTNASYITRVSEGGLSAETAMGALGTGLVINATTTGVPTIYGGTSCSNQFPRSLNASGAATCASVSLTADVTGTLPIANGGTGTTATADDQVLVGDSSSAATWRAVPNCTDTAGQHLNYATGTNGWSCGTSSSTPPGGNTTEVQYNNAGALAGMSNFETDGTHPMGVPVTAHPSSTSGKRTLYAFRPSTNTSSMGWSIEALMGIPLPEGALNRFGSSGLTASWDIGCVKTATWAVTTLLNIGMNVPTATGGAGTANAWVGSTPYGRAKIARYTINGVTTNGGVREAGGAATAWRGNSAGIGGFIYFTRFGTDTAASGMRWAIGMFNTTAALTNTSDPNAATDSVYMGCNAGDSNFSICSNDNTGTATCNTLGASYPCTTNLAFYDLWFIAPPNGSTIEWFVERLDSAASTSGTISSDLPRNSVQLSWQHWINTGSQTANVRLGFSELCIAVNKN